MLGLGNGAFREGPEAIYPLDSGSEQVVVGDFGGDGELDLACNADNSLTILIGKGDGTFKSPSVYGAGTASGSLATGDFDGDGDLDLASVNTKTDPATLVVLMRTGDGEFVPPTGDGPSPEGPIEFPPGAEVKSLTAADLDGDEKVDLVAADLTWHRLFVMWGEGEGKFDLEEMRLDDRRVSYPWDASVRPVVVEDLNLDGHPDLVTVNEFDGQVSVVLNNGDKMFQDEQTFDVGEGPGALAAGDVNGDGHLDLIVGNRHSYDVSILLGNGDGTFQPESRIAGGQELPPLLVDVNNDDRRDQVSVDDNTNEVLVRLDVGQGEFLESQRVSPEIRSEPILRDLNGDGSPDSVQINVWGDIVVHWGRPRKPGEPVSFDRAEIVNPGSPARDVAVLSTAAGICLAAVDVRETEANQPAGSITLYRFDANRREFVTTRTIPDGDFPTKIAAADLNGDGWDDFVVIEGAQHAVSVFLANGQGGFAAASSPIAVGDVPGEIALIDVAGPAGGPDGWIDIVVANVVSGDVAILINDSQGRFASERALLLRASDAAYGVSRRKKGEPLTVRSRAQTTGIAGGDFNGDGVLDLALTNYGLNTFSVLFGKASGGFVDPKCFLAGGGPTDIRASDLDGDQKPDLLVGNELGDLFVLAGNGDGSFQSFREGGENVTLAVGDFNGDGQEDAVVAKEAEHRLTVWLGDGNDFREHLSWGPQDGLASPRAVEVTDLDDDNNLDIVVANYGADNVLVYLGDGRGGFESPRTLAAGVAPVALATADLNGDNRPDVLVANELSNDVSVWFAHKSKNKISFQPGPRPRVLR